MYSEKVLDHFLDPHHVGEPENPSCVGTVGDGTCGDVVRIYLQMDADHVIRDAGFQTYGCACAVACSSMATDLLIGRTAAEAMELTAEALTEALDGLPEEKLHCAEASEEAIRAALWDYAQKNHLEIPGLVLPDSAVSGYEFEEG